MAWAKRQFRIVYEWEDREGTQTTSTLKASFDATGFGDGRNTINKAAALAPLIQAISSCRLIGYRVISSYVDEDAAYAGEVERRARMQFATAVGRKYQTQVPGFKDSLLDPNGRDIAVRGTSVKPEVQAFVDAVVDGPAGWSNGAVTIGGESLVVCKAARKVHVPSLGRAPRRSG